jgi:hypothetical protein
MSRREVLFQAPPREKMSREQVRERKREMQRE